MNGEVSDPAMKEKGWKVCSDFLGGLWREIALEDFRIFEVRGGFSNKLYRCALPENTPEGCGVPKEVLLRIYGPIQEDPNSVVRDAATFMLLAERKLGPKLYGLFPKGRLEEFIPSHSLGSDELRKYSTLTAREMAKIHALDVPVRKVADIYETYAVKWLDEIQELLARDKGKYFMYLNEYRKEMEWLVQEMKKSNSPVVYCHNDLQGGNVLYCEGPGRNEKPNLLLIDFEFGSYNYRGFDIANHLCEWCFDYDTTEYPHFKMDLDKFPTLQEQTEFFTAYVDQLLKEGVQLERPVGEEIDSMLEDIKLFACAPHLLWSLWSAKMVLETDTEGFYAIANPKNSEGALNGDTGNVLNDSTHHSKETPENGLIGAFKEHGKVRGKLYRIFKERYLTVHASKNKRQSSSHENPNN